MAGIAFRIRRPFQERFLIRPVFRANLRHLEISFGERPRLVKHDDLTLGQHFQIIAPLHQNPLPRRAPDAAKKAHGNRNHQCAGAGNNQEDERPVHPLRKLRSGNNERRNHRQQSRRDHHNRRVVFGEPGNKILRPRLFAAGIFHHFKNLGNRGLAKMLGNPDSQKAAAIDAAAQDFRPRPGLPGQGLPGERRRIQRRRSLDNLAVQRDLLARLHEDCLANRHLFRVDPQGLPISLHVGIIRTDIHQLGNRTAGTMDGISLEPLAHLVEQHHRHAFGILSQNKRPHGGNAHEKVFIKDFPPGNVADSPPENVPARHTIGRKEDAQPPKPL